VRTGPYISQFLLQPYSLGSTPTQQRYRTTVAGSDHLVSYAAWLAAQNGQPPTTSARYDPTLRFLRNGRDLAEWSHRDFSYQGPLVAALILLDYVARHGPQVLAAANPTASTPPRPVGSPTARPDILDQVARSANPAMKAAWYHKWLVHRRLRPEEAGGGIHHHLTGTKTDPLHPTLTDSAAPQRVYARYGSYLCPQAYPEGCPTTHPAYPGATAAIGGAGVRVLKALFNPDFVIPEPVEASDDGLSLTPWKGEPLTVGGAEQAGLQHGLWPRHRRRPLPQRRDRRHRPRRVRLIERHGRPGHRPGAAGQRVRQVQGPVAGRAVLPR
jgi:hypothetical protein